MSTIYALVAQAAQKVGHVGKGDRNQSQGFNFRGIDAVVNAVGPVFRELGIVVFPTLLGAEYDTVTVGHKQSVMQQVRVRVAYTFVASDGSEFTATVAAESMDSGDKATAKAMSVAFRTCLLQTLCLPTDEPDPDFMSYERSGPAIAASPRTPTGTTKSSAPAHGVALSKSQQIWVMKQASKIGDAGALAAVSNILGRTIDNLDSVTSDEARVLLPALSDLITE